MLETGTEKLTYSWVLDNRILNSVFKQDFASQQQLLNTRSGSPDHILRKIHT